MSASKLLVIWDFDLSLVNDNTDDFVSRHFFEEKFEEINKEMLAKSKSDLKEIWSWSKFVDQYVMPKVFKYGNLDRNKFETILQRIAIYSSNLKIIRYLAKQPNVIQYIVSDANTALIEPILRKHNLFGTIFKENNIISNPGWWDKKTNILRCKEYHDPVKDPHNCPLKSCPNNMCKGKIMNNELLKINHHKIIYIGDGAGDFCAITKLKSTDIALVRTFEPMHGLEKEIKNSKKIELKCKILKWSNEKELFHAFKLALMPHYDYNNNNNKENQIIDLSGFDVKNKIKIDGGSFGDFYKVKNLKNDKFVTFKSINAKNVYKNIIELTKFKSPFIANLIGFFVKKESNLITIVVEYSNNGSLMDILNKNSNKAFDLSEIKRVVKNILFGLQYLHEQNVIHLDIQPSNIILGDDNNYKLAHFGYGLFKNNKNINLTLNGKTSLYAAPEILSKVKYLCNERCDIYSIGIISMYLCLYSGDSEQDYQSIQKIKQNISMIDKRVRESVDFGSFIKKCIASNPSERCSAKELLASDKFVVQ